MLIREKHPKTVHKLSKTIKQAKKTGSNNPLYRDTKKWKFVKQRKWVHAFKGYASSYNVGILNSFNPELQL